MYARLKQVRERELSGPEAERCPLDGQQPLLCRSSAGSGESSGPAARSQNPMARNDKRDRVSSQGLSDGSGCRWAAQGFGELAIGAGLAGRDLSSSFVYAARKKAGSVERNGDVAKILQFPLKMLAHSRNDLSNFSGRHARFHRRRCAFRKAEQGHDRSISALAPGDPARAEWGLEHAVGELLHGDSRSLPASASMAAL